MKKLIATCFVSALLFAPAALAEASEEKIYSLLVSDCSYSEESLKSALVKLFEKAKLEHPERNFPHVVFVSQARPEIWDHPKLTMSLKNVTFGSALKTICDAGFVNLTVIGDIVIIHKESVLGGGIMTIVNFPDGAKLNKIEVNRSTSNEIIRGGIVAIQPEIFSSHFSIARIGDSDKFLIEGERNEIELVQAVSVLSRSSVNISR